MSRPVGLAVIAMAGRFGPYDDLAAFARHLYADEVGGAFSSGQSLEEDSASLDLFIGQWLEQTLAPRVLQEAAMGLILSVAEDAEVLVGDIARNLPSTGPVLGISGHDLASALTHASRWLDEGDADLVLIADVGALGVGVLLTSPSEAVAPGDTLAYLLSLSRGSRSDLEQICRRGLTAAGVVASQVGYLEAPMWPPAPEITAAYSGPDADRTCAVGHLPMGSDGSTAMARLIKTVLCISDRQVPASTPQSVSDVESDLEASWQGTPFYLAPSSRPWFVNPRMERRLASLVLASEEEAAHLVWAEPAPERRGSAIRPRATAGVACLVPIAGEDEAALISGLTRLQSQVEQGDRLVALADDACAAYVADGQAQYVVALVARSTAELGGEIERAIKGVRRAFSEGRDWRTPRGSAFTANPLGGSGVTFVYPGAFNAYVGLGRELFCHFPFLHEGLRDLVQDLEGATASRYLYPRTRELSDDVTPAAWAADFRRDPVAMMESGTTFAVAYTRIVRDLFGVEADFALGYSLGEGSMLWGTGVWADGDEGSANLHRSSLFDNRLIGRKEVVRRYWGEEPTDDDFWSIYLLKSPLEEVRAAVAKEPKVYVTIVNLRDEIVIAGDRHGCRRVIDGLDCHALDVPSDVVIHNEAMASAYDTFYDLYSHPVVDRPDIEFYSADDYGPVRLERDALAGAIARMSCQMVDFPRLVHRVHKDGGRVFVELGPQGTCTRWIQRILRGQPHAAVAINPSGARDFDGVIRVLAELVTQRVPVNLSPLLDAQADRRSVEVLLTCRPLSEPDTAQPEAVVDAPPVSAARKDDQGSVSHLQLPSSPDAVELYARYALPHRARAALAHEAFLKTRQEAQQMVQSVIEMQIEAGRRVLGLPAAEVPSAAAADLRHEGSRPGQRGLLSNVASLHRSPRFSEEDLQAFAKGDPEACFGPSFAVYRGRRLPRIPNGDLLLISRILEVDGEPGVFTGTPSLEAAYDVPSDAWFYGDAPGLPPYAVLMETAMQPCGFLSAYLESSLLDAEADLYFRNLDGRGRILSDVDLRGRTVRCRVVMNSSTRGPGTILQAFDFELSSGGEKFYEGWALFGYFTSASLTTSAGLDRGTSVEPWREQMPASLSSELIPVVDATGVRQLQALNDLMMVPGGGELSGDYLYGRVLISPDDWFFRAHFYQDPVMPGSLGVEAVLEAMRRYARRRYPSLRGAQEVAVTQQTVTWRYRGQVTPQDPEVVLEVHLHTPQTASGNVVFVGDASVWKSGTRIYEITGAAVGFRKT